MARRYHSPSSTELGARCQRAWAYCYIDKMREPEVKWREEMATRLPPGVTPKQRSGALGTAGHKVLEAYFEGRAPAWHTYPGQVVEAGRHLLPRPDAVVARVEAPIGTEAIPDPGDGPAVGFRFEGVLWAGFRDLVVSGAPELQRLRLIGSSAHALFDYKTTASIARYAKDAETLRGDVQCNLYALATMVELGDLPVLPARWVYFETKKVRRAIPVDVLIERTRAEDVLGAAGGLARELDLLERSADAPQNVGACDDYGGCSYHASKGGPCNAVRSVGRMIQLRRKKREPMALTAEQEAAFEKFKAEKAAKAGEAKDPPAEGSSPGADQGEADAPPPPPPAAKPPKAKPVAKAPAGAPGGLAAVIGVHQAELAAAEGELTAAQAKRDSAVAALRAALA